MLNPSTTVALALARDFCREHLTALCRERCVELYGEVVEQGRLAELRAMLCESFPNSFNDLSVGLVNEAARAFVMRGGS